MYRIFIRVTMLILLEWLCWWESKWYKLNWFLRIDSFWIRKFNFSLEQSWAENFFKKLYLIKKLLFINYLGITSNIFLIKLLPKMEYLKEKKGVHHKRQQMNRSGYCIVRPNHWLLYVICQLHQHKHFL